MPDCLGGDSCQTKLLLENQGAAWAVAHRIGRVIWLVRHEEVEFQEMGSAPLQPKTLQRKLRRLLQEFAQAGIDAQAAMAHAVASQDQGMHA
jgi:hypothetical protein